MERVVVMLFRDKVLSKTMDECIDSDLYWYGESFIRRVYRRMTSIKTLNNEYKILFDRKDSKYSYNYEYICHMIFINDIGVELLHLRFTEVCAFNMVDTLHTYLMSDYSDIAVSIDSVDTDLSDYFITIERDPNTGIHKFTVNKYSRTMDITNSPIILYLNDDLLEDMIYMMYFSYLIDIDTREDYYLLT